MVEIVSVFQERVLGEMSWWMVALAPMGTVPQHKFILNCQGFFIPGSSFKNDGEMI